jgi:hypothetical protein
MSLPPPAIREYLREIGIQVDIMDTVRPIRYPCRNNTHEVDYRRMHVPHSICWARRVAKWLRLCYLWDLLLHGSDIPLTLHNYSNAPGLFNPVLPHSSHKSDCIPSDIEPYHFSKFKEHY